jgi:hypothetical protein
MKEPVYYIEKKIFGMIIKIPIKASEIEALHDQLMCDAQLPKEDLVLSSVFDKPEEVHR